MSRYESERAFSDRYIPAIQQIVGPLLLKPAPFELDANQATDLIVMTARDIRIAARVRRANKYLERYGYEFTLRAKLQSGAKTEMTKVVDNNAQWLFYGFADPNSAEVPHWWLINLDAFRAAFIRQAFGGQKVKCGLKDNGDGTHFYWFDLRSFPREPSILIAGSRELPKVGVAA